MSVPKTEYSNTLLSSLTPVQVVEAMKRRMNGATATNDDVADWFRERARIEDSYASELQKLAKRAPSKDFGGLDPVWQSVSKNLGDHAEACRGYARKLDEEVTKPLRSLMISSSPHKNTQWQDFKSQHSALAQVAHNLHHAEDGFEKARRKGSKNTETLQIQLAEARSQWENQAPFVVEQFENLDDARLVFFKDALTRAETLHVDKCQNGIKHSEDALNAVLGFEPLEDMRLFLVSASQAPGPSSGSVGSGGGGGSGSRTVSEQPLPPLPGPQRAASHDSGLYDPPARHASFAGVPIDDSSSVASKEKSGAKLRSKVGSIFRRGRNKQASRDKDGWDLPRPANARSSAANARSPIRDSIRENPIRESPSDSSTSVGQQQQHQYQQQPESPSGVGPKRASSMPLGAASAAIAGSDGPGPGSGVSRTPSMPLEPLQPTRAKPAPPPSRKANGPNGPVSPIAETSADERFPEPPNGVHPAQYGQPGQLDDAEPPLKFDIRQNTISEEGDDTAALSNVASALRSRPTASGRALRGRRDIQSRLFTTVEPTDIEHTTPEPESPVSPSSDRQAPQSFLSQLQSFPAAAGAAAGAVVGVAAGAVGSAIGATGEPEATNGERAQPDTARTATEAVSGQAVSGQAVSGETAPGQAGAGQALSHEATAGTDATPAYVPGATAGSLPAATHATTTRGAAQPIVSTPTGSFDRQSLHPPLPVANGLTASIVDVYNATVKDGAIVEASSFGEIAFGYSRNEQQLPGHVDIRVQGHLDRVVPNQAFVQSGSANDGEYKISNLAAIADTQVGVAGIKYSRAPQGISVPLIFTPIWRIEEHQSRLMLTLRAAETVQVDELTVTVDVEGVGRAVSAQSRPAASFNRELQRVTWRLTEPFGLQAGSETQFLCQLLTEGGSVRESSSGVEIKFRLTAAPTISLEHKSTSPFGDETSWEPVPTVGLGLSGNYVASSE